MVEAQACRRCMGGITVIDYLEWIGAISGLLGAFLLATHTHISRYGWVAFLAANIALIGFAIGIERYGLLLQQSGFMATSLLGLYRAGMIPAWIARNE
jgi:hypothetical protein